MRTFFKKLLIFLAPALGMVLFFLIFEPYDYWSVKGWSWYDARPISCMREAMLEQPERVLLGDSKMANLNTDYIEEVGGGEWTMLAYGGSTLYETIQEFYWVAERNPNLSEVILGFSFYSASPNHYSTKIVDIFPVVEQPMRFVTNVQYWLDALVNFRNLIFGIEADDPSDLDRIVPVSNEGLGNYRKDISEYADIIYEQMLDYGDIYETLAMLDELFAFCEERDIELSFVLFPCNRAIWEMVIYPLGIDDAIAIYHDYLKQRATVYDMEFRSELSETDQYYIDGFHLTGAAKKEIIRVIFGGETAGWCRVTTPETYIPAD